VHQFVTVFSGTNAVTKISENENHHRIWELIKNEHVALLVTQGEGGALNSRPMGFLQQNFAGTLWFITFKESLKLFEIENQQQVLVSFRRPVKYEFVSISGRARVVEDRNQVRTLWREGFRVWFPQGPESANIALIAVEVETAKTWTKPAPIYLYAYYYVRARLTGKSPSPRMIVDHEIIHLSSERDGDGL